MIRIINYSFRWPIKLAGEKQIEVQVPLSMAGTPILNPEFCDAQDLSIAERDEAEHQVLESIAIIR